MNLMDSFDDAWEVICSYCKTKITDVAYNTWISRIKPLKLDFESNTAYLVVPNDFHRQTLTRCYVPLLNEAFEAVFDNKFIISFNTPEEVEEYTKAPEIKEEIKDTNYEYTFDTFIVGSSNKFAHAACLAVATNPSHAYNPLFLWGNSGLGKTHLLYAIGNEIKKNDPSKVICYIKGDDFTNELIESLRLAKMSEFRHKYRQADILLVDDVQFIGGKESTQEEFFHTFNALYDAHKQIILTSDRPPRDIQHLEDRILTRFEGGLIVDIQPPDTELRIAIAKSKAEIMNVKLSNDVLTFIGENIKSNVRQIEGAIKKLGAYGFVNQTPITVDMVKTLLSAVIDNTESPELMANKIIESISKRYDISVDDIKGKKRTKEIVSARHIAVYVVREVTGMSFPNIAKLFNRDHTTMLSSIDVVEEEMNKNSAYEHEIESIIKEFKS